MITEHHDAILALLEPLPHTLYDGQVPDRPVFPYAVVFMDTDTEFATKLCGVSDVAEFRFQVNSVGLSRAAVDIVADAVRVLVLDVRPVVAGRKCDRIDKETSIPIRADTDVTDPETELHPMFAVDRYSFVSHAD